MTILYTLIIMMTGTLVSYCFIKSMDVVKRLSIGIGLGLLIYSLVYFVFIVFNLSLAKENVMISASMVLVVSILINFKNKRIFEDIKKITNKQNLWFIKSEKKYLFILMSAIIASTFLIAVFWPISEWDALTLYDFRGKLYSDGLLFKDVQALDSFDTYNPGYYFSYPILTSIIHASYYVLGSTTPQIIYPLLFVGLILFFYKSLAEYVSRNTAFVLTGVLVSINTFVSHASVPYTNLPYTYFYFISTVLLIEYIYHNINQVDVGVHKKGRLGLLLLSSVFLAGSSWVRSVEPFYLVNILLLLYHFILKRIKLLSLIVYSLPVVLIKKIWESIQNLYAPKSFLNNLDLNLLFSNLFIVLPSIVSKSIFAYVSFIYKNSIIFLILAVCTYLFFINLKNKKDGVEKLYLFIIYADLAIIFAGTLLVGLILVGRNEIYDSISRFGMFLYPFIIFVGGLSLKSNLEFKDK